MKNLIIIILSIAFIPTINAQDIETELYNLFASMEKGFKDDMKNLRNDELKHSEYSTLIEPGNMDSINGRIYKMDNGIIFYGNVMEEGQDEIIEALETFPVSRGYKVETLAEASDSYHYVVKNNAKKAIGFLKIYQMSGMWGFNANLPFDRYKFKNDINSIFGYAKSGFSTVEKTYLQEDDRAKVYKATKKINYVNEPIISIFNNDQLDLMYLAYKLTDFEALKYQIKEMNLFLSGYEKKIEKDNEKEFSYLFKSKESEITLEISQEADPLTPSIIISHQKIQPKTSTAPSKPKGSPFGNMKKLAYDALKYKDDIVHPSTSPYQPFSGTYEGDNLLILVDRHYKDPAIQDWIKQPGFTNIFDSFEKANGDLVRYKNESNGIELFFRNNRLRSIEIRVSEFKGELPLAVTSVATLDDNPYIEFLTYRNRYSFNFSRNSKIQFEKYNGKVNTLEIYTTKDY